MTNTTDPDANTSFTLYLPNDLRTRLEAAADAEERSLAGQIRYLLTRAVDA